MYNLQITDMGLIQPTIEGLPPQVGILRSPDTNADGLMCLLEQGIQNRLTGDLSPLSQSGIFSHTSTEGHLIFNASGLSRVALSINAYPDPTEFATHLKTLIEYENPATILIEAGALSGLREGLVKVIFSRLNHMLGGQITSLTHFADQVGTSVAQLTDPTFILVSQVGLEDQIVAVEKGIMKSIERSQGFEMLYIPAGNIARILNERRDNGLGHSRPDAISQILLQRMDFGRLMGELAQR